MGQRSKRWERNPQLQWRNRTACSAQKLGRALEDSQAATEFSACPSHPETCRHFLSCILMAPLVRGHPWAVWSPTIHGRVFGHQPLRALEETSADHRRASVSRRDRDRDRLCRSFHCPRVYLIRSISPFQVPSICRGCSTVSDHRAGPMKADVLKSLCSVYMRCLHCLVQTGDHTITDVSPRFNQPTSG